MKKHISYFLVGLLLISIVSCVKEDLGTVTGIDGFKSLIISDNFDFKNTQEVDVQISVLDQITSMIEIYDGDPGQGGNLLRKGLTDSYFSFKTKLVLPATVKEVYVIRHSFDGSVHNQIIPVSSSHLSYNFGFKDLKSANLANLVDNGNFENTNYGFLYENNLQSNISSSNIDNWILKTEQNNKPNSYWHNDVANSNHVIQMTDYATNKETFAYYYIEADPGVEYTLEIDGKIKDLQSTDLPYMSLQFMGANGQIINDYYLEYASTSWTTKTLTQTSPANTVYIKVVMATTDDFEGEVWFDLVNLTGETSPTILDTDLDGAPDAIEDYPLDPLRAFNSYYPNTNTYSSVAFEDLWPSMGDYDFNDLVVNFQYKSVTNASNQVVDLVGKFKIKAVGATLNNGFGFSFDALPASVFSVTGSQIMGSGITVASNGLEAGHTNKAVVIVCDKINTYAGASLLNTDANGILVDVPLITITINFASPQSSIGTEPFNPFIYISQTRGREVHMLNMPPTELVDPTWFGQDNDASVPANSVYYKTINNYPFALETPVPLDYPTEKTDIVTAHLKFGSWAESSGSLYQDWYDNQPGYRNSNKIKTNIGSN